jgi:hypothetical protein
MSLILRQSVNYHFDKRVETRFKVRDNSHKILSYFSWSFSISLLFCDVFLRINIVSYFEVLIHVLTVSNEYYFVVSLILSTLYRLINSLHFFVICV